MIAVTFAGADGGVMTAEAVPGDLLLDVAQAAGQPLEGACEGQMACATCHVVIDPDNFARLPGASRDEEEMLDLVSSATRTSRLACQVMLDASLVGLTVTIPTSATGGRRR